MEYSKGLTALDAMIEQDWMLIGVSDLHGLLKQLEEDGYVTAAEHKSFLMRLARKYTEPSQSEPQ
jgi:hypothetical protein